MANKTKTVSKISASVIAAASIIAIPFIYLREGDKLEAYEDVVGVWTICGGVTAGVKPGMKLSKADCDSLTRSTIGQFMTRVAEKMNVVVTPQTLAAHTSFAYNIGVAGYDRSSALRLTNQGKLAEGCRAMINWYTAGGKDCRIKSNNCYGLIKRREAEINLCLSGIK